jgi:integrase
MTDNMVDEKPGVEQVLPVTSTVREVFLKRSALKRAKIENFCFHDLRHCAKTSWARRGIPAEVAMKAGGHKSWQMHARYIHIQKTDMATCSVVPRASPRNPGTPRQQR